MGVANRIGNGVLRSVVTRLCIATGGGRVFKSRAGALVFISQLRSKTALKLELTMARMRFGLIAIWQSNLGQKLLWLGSPHIRSMARMRFGLIYLYMM